MTIALKEGRPLSELLPWLFLDEFRSTVVNKDSSLMAVYAYAGIDAESREPQSLEAAALIHDEALRAAAHLPVRIWHRVDRSVVNVFERGTFSHPMAEEIDTLWGRTFDDGRGTFQNTATLSIAMATGSGRRALMDLARERLDRGESALRAFAGAVRDRFKSKAKDTIGFSTPEEFDEASQRFEQNVLLPMRRRMHHLDMRRLSGDMLCGHLRAITSGGEARAVAYNPLVYLDAALSDTWIDNRYRDYLVLTGAERRYAAVLTLKSAPPGNNLGRLDALLALPIELTIGSCWTAARAQESIKELKAARTFDELSRMDVKSLLRVAMTSGNELLEGDNAPRTEVGVAAMDYVDQIRQSTMNFGYMACSIVVYANDPIALKRHVEAVQNVLAISGLLSLREREGALCGLAATIPGNVDDPVRWFHVETGNVTDLACLVTLDPGPRQHPHFSRVFGERMPAHTLLRSRRDAPIHFSNHVGELGHTLILGPSGNGKTVFQMFLESQFLRYPNATVVNFDKGYSCEATTLLHDGACFDLTPGAPARLKMNPLAHLSAPGGVTWCTGWIDRLMSLRGAPLTDKELAEVSERLQALKDLPGVRLNSLRVLLPDGMKDRLAFWCEGGMYGEFFDNPDDELRFDRMTTFELAGLIERNNHDVLRAFTDYVFFRIQRRFAEFDERSMGPTQIYFEEAGFLLEDPTFEKRAVDYLTTLRKVHAHLTMTAQSPEVFARSPLLKAAVRENVATVIFLPNDKAERGALAESYRDAFGVNDHHLGLIANAIPKREYCLWQSRHGWFRIAVAAFPREIIARLRSDASTRALLESHWSATDVGWRDRYLQAVMALDLRARG